uniref:Uncharacterized protein n=1 Tax=Chromera velia CCMP2878 TaxID=1169474 RepID=A0A0G4GPV8_9ALVE|eukprot:Cvel_22857.t1-p1 / transcript=Cvel_22857.t1 / gene=Cvel_22857 / organism=Chromera_velia_CCMP2878 / gene_product=hypothetical protein / transcript_product=hypothetical protein / location=Cvel_scaffold2293:11436-13175(+) / protein_length=437 / sequence_SO=supercontig / SO=protein_coding / is_pseudo=false
MQQEPTHPFEDLKMTSSGDPQNQKLESFAQTEDQTKPFSESFPEDIKAPVDPQSYNPEDLPSSRNVDGSPKTDILQPQKSSKGLLPPASPSPPSDTEVAAESQAVSKRPKSKKGKLPPRQGAKKGQSEDCPPAATLKTCRGLFKPDGFAGASEKTLDSLLAFIAKKNATTFNVVEHLKDFTGLSHEDVLMRLQRQGRFHYEAEYKYWNPETPQELAWYYASSVNYLFGNALHSHNVPFGKENEPVLDFAGGVGNDVIGLAMKGIKCIYFGIGQLEASFAEYRVRRLGLSHLVTFLKPWGESTGWKFDPVRALPRDGSVGAVLAFDVFEHIPEYHKVVRALVESLRVGGGLVEFSPFSPPIGGRVEDLRLHLSDGGVTMQKAMGEGMKFDRTKGMRIWWKASETPQVDSQVVRTERGREREPDALSVSQGDEEGGETD